MKKLNNTLLLFFLFGLLTVHAQTDGPQGWECFTPEERTDTGTNNGSDSGNRPGLNTGDGNAAVVCSDSDVKFVNLNVHYMQRSCGLPPGNFTATEDGMGSSEYTGLDHARDIVKAANWTMLRNWRAVLQVDPTSITPFPPKRIQYILNGVYYHADDDYFQEEGSDSDINQVYGENINTEYNIYVTGGFAGSSGGWAIPADNAMIIRKAWWNFHNPPQYDPLDGAGDVINHELGHLWGLNHSFSCTNNCNGIDINVPAECNSGCDCVNSNCSPCNNWGSGGNNMMGYNTFGNSVTPCQLITIHNALETFDSDYVAFCCSDWTSFTHPTNPLTQMNVDACEPNMCPDFDIVSTVNDCFEGCNVTYSLDGAPSNVCANWTMTVWDADGNVVNTENSDSPTVNDFVGVGNCFQACVTFCGDVCTPFTLCSDVEMCNSTAVGPVVDFHFEHENGSEDSQFDLCEDVWLDGSANQDVMQHGITVWKIIDGQQTYVDYEGSINASPEAPFNLSEVLLNMGEIFVAPSTYIIKYNVYYADCGWQFRTLEFDLLEPMVNFHFEHANGQEDTQFNICEDVWLDGTANQGVMQHGITVWKIVDGLQTYVDYNGNISASPNSPFNLTAVLQTMDDDIVAPATYIIKYNIYYSSCGWQSETLEFDLLEAPPVVFNFEHANGVEDTEFNICEEVWLDGSANPNVMQHGITVWKIVDGLQTYVDYDGSINPSPTAPFNLSEILENMDDDIVAPSTYIIKYNIYMANCGWQHSTMQFDLLPANVDFHFEHENGVTDTEFTDCEDVWLDGSANQNIMQHGITVWKIVGGIQTYVGYNGNISASPDAPFNLTEVLQAMDDNIVAPTTFVIKYNVYTENCGWQFEIMNFDLVPAQIDFFFADEDMNPGNTFGPCEDVWIDGSGNLPGTDYNLTLWKIVGNNQELQGATGLIEGTPNWENITFIFENLPDPVDFQPGCTYRLRLEIYPENCTRIMEQHEFTLLPGALQAAGIITNWCSDSPVNLVNVQVEGPPNCAVTTGPDGLYSCLNTTNYTITPSKLINVGNGVSTWDMLLILQHIAGFNIFDDPYEYIAADADHNEELTSDDFDAIAQVVLSLADEFPNNTSWRFHDPLTSINWVAGFPMIQEFIDSDVCRAGNDFVGIKIGDVNCTADPQSLTGGTEQRIAYLENDPRMSYRAGEKVIIPLTLLQAKNIIGLQLGLTYDTKALKYLGLENVQLKEFSTRNYNDKEEGKIRVAWVSRNLPDGQFILNDKGMINLSFIAQTEISNIADFLFLQETMDLDSEIYLSDLSREQLEFENFTLEGKLSNMEESLTLDKRVDIYPNPAKDQLIYNSNNGEIVELSILNTNSQLVKRLKIDRLQKGTIDISDLPAGTYFLKFVDTNEEVVMKKVVKIE